MAEYPVQKNTEGKIVAVVPEVKPGWKTTEFWVALIPKVIGILAVTGALTPDQADALTSGLIEIAGIAAVVASSFGYSISRGKAKGK